MASDGTQPKRGDLIEIHRFYFTHWAIYVGKGYVVHLAPASGVAGAGVSRSTSIVGDRAIVKKELLSVVAGGDKYQVNNKHDDKYEPLPLKKIAIQAKEMVGKEVPYSLTHNNCEHFVNQLRYGVSHSDQGGTQLKVGDLIEIFRSYFAHWAIYVGKGYVVHLAPPSEVAGARVNSSMSIVGDRAIVKKELLSVVAGGDKYQVNNRHDDKYEPLPPNKIVQRAEEMVGKKISYSVTHDNCEHFVNELRYGVSRSDQGGTQLKVGDLIEIFRSYFAHWAIYVGKGYVVHLAPPSGMAGARVNSSMSIVGDRAIVKKELLSVVAGGDKYQVNNRHDDKYEPLPPNKIIQRAEEMVGKEIPYSVTHNNCEHFVNELRYGVSRSDQGGTQLKVGDLIEMYRSYFAHWAIYVGNGYVVHLVPASGVAGARVSSSTSIVVDRAIVKKELLSVVAFGYKYQVNNKHDDKYEPLPSNKIIQRAEEMVGKEIPYSVTQDNCEHFVNELRYGVSRSDQVTDMVAVVGVAAAFLVGFPSLGVAGLLGMALARRKRDKQ